MDNPDSKYHKFQEVDHAGHAILSLEDKEHLPHVLIKERPDNKSIPGFLKAASHKNVVSLLSAFHHSGVVSLVYECDYVNMTVASVSGCAEFKETDIATVCREVLQGLEYIHSELRIAHGSVNDKNVLLTLSGDVKIANIGDSMLNAMTLRDRDLDLKAVGKIAMNLQDRSTKLENLDVEHWTSNTASDSIRQFIKNTGEQTMNVLLKHDFLTLSGPSWTLKPYIMAALKFDSASRRAMGFKD
ncbi:hypothetical protein BGW36DRAFT_304284 [Talaromyces proteolyticus]|uniref:Protein kinase domain-containing protein n=1 Tax=Talaromyces proteolyticus TaxID=1131652 RepID=A0AAD4KIB1_9EURO|nr:uncharacterized protein BGW36DRAFT_304284 [Talaromyces proteolyticus]KAH8691897.1 hypothetical protein BGW36DRAFT_304284 [Talaromyces proteolyticus]